MRLAFVLAVGALLLPSASAQSDDAPRILVVTAHPDDEAMLAATIYQITQALGGEVDLALLTDGSGGYTYSALAEPIYGLDLTDEAVARKHLPAIRKQELMEGGRVIGLRKYFFFDELDHAYTLDVDTVLQHIWAPDPVRARLARIMTRGDYDFVFTHLPVADWHGHHKAATILALEAARTLPESRRPVVLGCMFSTNEAPGPPAYTQLDGYAVTRVAPGTPVFTFDRNRTFGPNDRLNYQIVANWLIAAHKTQGSMQRYMNGVDFENYYVYAENPADAVSRTRALFERLEAAELPDHP